MNYLDYCNNRSSWLSLDWIGFNNDDYWYYYENDYYNWVLICEWFNWLSILWLLCNELILDVCILWYCILGVNYKLDDEWFGIWLCWCMTESSYYTSL